MSDTPRTFVFVCTNIGQCDDGVKVEQERNTDGTYYFRASSRITHVFGSEIQGGECEGFGTTEQQARERLADDLRKFNDSLWF